MVFFILPEIVAALWGERIQHYFVHLAAEEVDMRVKKIYEMMEDFGKVSYLNLALGLIFTIWFFYERKKRC